MLSSSAGAAPLCLFGGKSGLSSKALTLVTHTLSYLSGKFSAQDRDVLTRCIHGHDVALGMPRGKSVRVKPDVVIVNQGVWYNAQARNRQKQEAELLRSGFHEGITVPLTQRNVTHPILTLLLFGGRLRHSGTTRRVGSSMCTCFGGGAKYGVSVAQ